MLKVSLFFVALSLGVTYWLGQELGVMGYTPAVASEGGENEGIESLAKSIQERTKQVEEKEGEINRRERSVQDKEIVFQQQIDRYEKIIQEQKKKIASLEALNNSKVEGFRRLYEKMEPKKVAQILEEMEPELVAELLGEMRAQISVEILGKLSTKKARLLTEKYLSKRLPASKAGKGQ